MRGVSSQGMLAFVLIALPARIATAGMPGITLTDVARMRLQTISFFLLVALISALVVQVVWNTLRREFPRLPRLSYPKACGLVTLWGLLFVVVLTMISGARELMTPGAWEKQGLTYQLGDNKEPPERKLSDSVGLQTSWSPKDELMPARLAKLERLRHSLLTFARVHEGKFPSDPDELGLLEDDWLVPDASQMKYVYVPGLSVDVAETLLFEPQIFGETRFVLRTTGELVLESPSSEPLSKVDLTETAE